MMPRGRYALGLLLLGISLFAGACSKKHEVWYELVDHQGARVLAERYWTTREGGETVKHGRYGRWYTNGQASVEGAFFYGKPDGTWSYFYGDGRPMMEATWDRGEVTDSFTFWDAEGVQSRLRADHSTIGLEGSNAKAEVLTLRVPRAFFADSGIEIIAGRSLALASDSDSAIVVNELAVSALGLDGDPSSYLAHRLDNGRVIVGVSGDSFRTDQAIAFLLEDGDS